MEQNSLQFRPIQMKDNLEMANIIKTVMTEYDCVGAGYSIEDAEVNAMFENYCKKGFVYLVLENKEEKIMGGGGIGALIGGDADTCELKKMYFSKEARGLGMGKKLVEILLQKAKEMGYAKCYLETVGRMETANFLYKKMGFKRLKAPMGNTGHSSCEIQYLLEL